MTDLYLVRLLYLRVISLAMILYLHSSHIITVFVVHILYIYVIGDGSNRWCVVI